MGWYFPSGTARTPDEDPSTNSMGGGSRLLKAAKSLVGRYCDAPSANCCGENELGKLDDAT
jgi:hypothetical protein